MGVGAWVDPRGDICEAERSVVVAVAFVVSGIEALDDVGGVNSTVSDPREPTWVRIPVCLLLFLPWQFSCLSFLLSVL